MLEQNFFKNQNSNNKSKFVFDLKSNFSSEAIKKNSANRSLNDFDSSLILEKINKTVTNKAVKLGMKISTLQKELKKVNEKIELLELLNLSSDKKKLDSLLTLRTNIENSLNLLLEEQKKKGTFYYINSFLDEKFKLNKFIEKMKPICYFLYEQIKKFLLIALRFLINKYKSFTLNIYTK